MLGPRILWISLGKTKRLRDSGINAALANKCVPTLFFQHVIKGPRVVVAPWNCHFGRGVRAISEALLMVLGPFARSDSRYVNCCALPMSRIMLCPLVFSSRRILQLSTPSSLINLRLRQCLSRASARCSEVPNQAGAIGRYRGITS